MNGVRIRDRLALSSFLIAAFFNIPAFAQSPKCEKGFQPLSEGGCVSQVMFDFLACVKASGGNAKRISELVSSVVRESRSGGASGKGGTVVASGSGSLQLAAGTEKEILSKIERENFPGAMDSCKDIAKQITAIQPYPGDKRAEDLRVIRSYLARNGNRVFAAQSVLNCPSKETSRKTEFGLRDNKLTLTQSRSDRETCPAGTENAIESTCTARIEELDQVLLAGFGQTPSEREFTLRCLAGNCFECQFIFNDRLVQRDWKTRKTSDTIDRLDIFVSTEGGFAGDEPMTAFLAAFTRVIGSGDNSQFCRAQPHLCK